MLTQPRIATFTAARDATVQCASCGTQIYTMKPYEAIYPQRSVGRALGATHTVEGECKCGLAYKLPVTRTV